MDKRVLVADKIATVGVDYLKSQPGIVVEVMHGLDEKGLCEAIPGYHGVLVRSAAKITAKVLDAADELKVIGRAGIGVDNIDVEHATEKGVVVLNTPNANATTTAELAFAHILSLSRNLPEADRSIRAGEWKRSQLMGAELANKTLGIIGYGTIGRIVANRAKAFQMNVIVFDPFVTEEICKEYGVSSMELDDMLAEADYVSFHCPVNDKTRNLLNAERLAKMKKGARLINCARGGLVDEEALYEAVKSGHLAGAALDVFVDEPPGQSPLFELDNVVFTPHLGASTSEAQTTAGLEIAQQVATYLQTGEPVNAINLPAVSSDEIAKLKPYIDLTGRLGKILAPMLEGPVEKLDISLSGDACERDARSITVEALMGLLKTNVSMTINRVNAISMAEQYGIKLTQTTCGSHPDYHTAVAVTAHHGDTKITVEGTLFNQTMPRLVRINSYEVEAILEGHLLVTRQIDQPGIVAAVSSILAKNNINISRMQMGHVDGNNNAMAVLTISTPVSDEMLEEIAAVEAIIKVMQVTL